MAKINAEFSKVVHEYDDAGCHRLLCVRGCNNSHETKDQFMAYVSIAEFECLHGHWMAFTDYFGERVIAITDLVESERHEASEKFKYSWIKYK